MSSYCHPIMGKWGGSIEWLFRKKNERKPFFQRKKGSFLQEKRHHQQRNGKQNIHNGKVFQIFAFGFFVCPCLLPPSFPALPLQPMLLVPRNLFMCDLSFFCYLRLPSYYCILFEPLPGASSSWGCPLFASSPRSTLLPPPFPL